MAIILGIDPGSRLTGYGIIESKANKQYYISSGCIRTQADDLTQRLQQIFVSIKSIIADFQPTVAAIEQVFMHRNANSALKLGQARGAALVALGYYGLDVMEYSARQVKQAIVGYGGADKQQIQHMVQTLLQLSGKPQVDAADALAIAICHANTRTYTKMD